MEYEITENMKQLIKLHDVEGIKTYYTDIMQQNYDIDIQNIYKELILYSCYHGNNQVIKFFVELYHQFDDISKIALRQLFFHCKYILLRQKKDVHFLENFLNKIRVKK